MTVLYICLKYLWHDAPGQDLQVQKDDSRENVDIDIQQHIELKYVSCGGGHLAIVSFCQEHKPGEVVDQSNQVNK